MLKLTKKVDYGLIAVKHLAAFGATGSCSAADIAEVYCISAPLLAKVLQRLARQGLVTSRHGSGGGYQLARDPKEITAFEVIDAIDGPLRITSCVTSHGECGQTTTCTVREPLRRVNESILQVLRNVTISEMGDESGAPALVELSS